MKENASRRIRSAVVVLLLTGTAARAQDLRPVPAADSPPIDVYDGFETPALGKLWATWRFAPGAVQMQSETVRAGHGAVRITLRPRDVLGLGKNGDADTERDELAEAEELYSREGRSYEFSWSMYLPPDFPIVPVRLVVAQWKQQAANESAPAFDDHPVLAVRYSSGVLRITQNRDRRPQAVLYRETRDLRGHWLDLRFQVRLTSQSTGFVRAWLDGRQIVNYAGPTANAESANSGYANPSQFYFKMGLYRDLMPQPMTIYLDEYRKRQLREDELPPPP
jgi:hypothetical protein